MKLLLKGGLPEGLDSQQFADQLDGMAYAPAKWPRLAANSDIAYPCRLSREQSSSESTARYKAELVSKSDAHNSKLTLADLTGGMGIDSMAFASVASHVDYIEQDLTLCEIMTHNANALNLCNITCHHSNCIEWLKATCHHFDWIYLDPARRGGQGQKLVRLTDCHPNVVELMPLLQERCDRLLIKASPMIDIHDSLRLLGNEHKNQWCPTEVHIVAANHECKEVLFICQHSTSEEKPSVRVVCVDLRKKGLWRNEFVLGDETQPKYTDEIQKYLYEPNRALMKGAPWGEICEWYNVTKIDRNSHLYTSDKVVTAFPGRIFEVLKEVRLNKKSLKQELKQANILVRNYPVDADTLRGRLGIADGGEMFIVATTVCGKKKALLCRAIPVP